MRRVAIGLAIVGAMVASAPSPALAASSGATVTTNHGCYHVGQPVGVSGSGFAARRLYEIAIDGVDFGQSRTDASGAFRTRLVPGGLGANIVQHVETLEATDGTRHARTRFTLTRWTGARFLAAGGRATTLRAPFQAWGFGLDGTHRVLYLHYVGPSGRARRTTRLGRAGGQCGYLQTDSMRVFPFTPSLGRWKLQVDARRGYSSRPPGPVARIFVAVRRGGEVVGLG